MQAGAVAPDFTLFTPPPDSPGFHLENPGHAAGSEHISVRNIIYHGDLPLNGLNDIGRQGVAEPVIKYSPGSGICQDAVSHVRIAALVLGELFAVFIEDHHHIVFDADYFINHVVLLPLFVPHVLSYAEKCKFRINIGLKIY
jgi:hypothetical protein